MISGMAISNYLRVVGKCPACSNSRPSVQHVDLSQTRTWLRCRSLRGSVVSRLVCLVCLASSFWILPPAPLKAEDAALTRLERIYQEARSRFQQSTSSIEADWQFGRACFDI